MSNKIKLLFMLLKKATFIYLIVCLLMWAGQRYLMYVPSAVIHAPEAYGLQGYEALQLQDEDGTHVQAWYHKAHDGFPPSFSFMAMAETWPIALTSSIAWRIRDLD